VGVGELDAQLISGDVVERVDEELVVDFSLSPAVALWAMVARPVASFIEQYRA